MPQYWIKPLGVTDPPDLVPADWLGGGEPPDPFEFMTGPATPRRPPQIGRGDLIVFHAVGHVRLFAIGEILGNPDWRRDPKYDLRWPWVYLARLSCWVPHVDQGPHPLDAGVPAKALNRMMTGAAFAQLNEADFRAAERSVVSAPGAVSRP